MNAQMPALSIATPTTTGNATTSGSKQNSNLSGVTGKDVFAGLLVSQVGTSPSNEQLDTNMSVLMALSVLPPTIQPIQDNQGDLNTADQLVQTLQNNPELTQELLADPNVQQWLQDAMTLMQALDTTKGLNNKQAFQLNAGLNIPLEGTEVQSAQLQQVLLKFAQLLEQQPDQPFVQHLQAQLQAALAPHQEAVASGVSNNAPLTSAIQSNALTAVDKQEDSSRLVNKLNTTTVKPESSEGKSAASTESVHFTAVTTKSSSGLEILTSKGALSAAQLVNPETSESALQDAPILADDATNNVVLQAGNVLKELTGTANEVAKATTTSMNAANFAEEMSRFVVKSLQVKLGEGFSEAKLSLYPQHLGLVDVKITMQNGHMMAQFAAQTAAAKELLESQLPQLRQMLQNQGLQVDKLEVAQSSQLGSSMFHNQQQRQQAFQQDRNSGKASDTSISSATYTTEESELLADIAAAKERVRSNSSGGLFQASV
ncbi:flagellar hook-length control protein FliK [Paenibacillus sp. KN14-4R]|uniref:flagellar hook-length control protein FliK n=1 Tax=Paenibacillus sp. KN14-4R TaxID=3445773 RepID=UPI003FA09CED